MMRLQVLGKWRYFKLFSKMERRAEAAPDLARAKWKAIELHRNFECWLRGSRSVRERAAQIGGESLELWNRADMLWDKDGSKGLLEWQQIVLEQLQKM